jgi:copper(I)-binding protein
MKKFFLTLFLAALFLTACGSNMPDEITAKKAWARSAMKGGNGAAYMLLQNGTRVNDELIGVSSDVAEATEIHLSQIKADGTMEMTPQESIPLPARSEVEFKPGSYHVMLIGLKRDIKADDEISLTLHFKNYEDLTLNVPVRDAENMGGSGMDGHMP